MVNFPSTVRFEQQTDNVFNCGLQSIHNVFSVFPTIKIDMAFLNERIVKEKYSDSSYMVHEGEMDIRFVRVALRHFIDKKTLSVNKFHFPFIKSRGPTWDSLLTHTPKDAHLLIVLGKCDSNSTVNHYISVNLILGVVFDSSIDGVAFQLDVRTVALKVLRSVIAAVAITFHDISHIDNMIHPYQY
jgi:hypothetical protein